MRSSDDTRPGTWAFLAAVLAAQIAGIIVAFAIADPCACKKDLADLRAQLDRQAADLLELYEDRAKEM